MYSLALGPSFLDPDTLIANGGLLMILAIVFAESGLLIGFFLPGDSLLFTAGLLTADGEYVPYPLWVVCLAIMAAAVAGDQVGYLFGRRVGPALFRRPDSRLFKQENVTKANEFFERHGPKAIVLARFVPIVRTFTPIIAGVSQMNYRTFVVYNVVGGVLWGGGVTTLGYFLGQIAFVRENIEAMLIGIVFLSVVPVVIEFLRARRGAGRPEPRPAPGPAVAAGAPLDDRTAVLGIHPGPAGAGRGQAPGRPYDGGHALAGHHAPAPHSPGHRAQGAPDETMQLRRISPEEVPGPVAGAGHAPAPAVAPGPAPDETQQLFIRRPPGGGQER
ncbi:DedA family protein [Allostreptomyces psammosilenae]|uniref:Membrane protein DedA with SNARE-associated domain n=1 Tax=Allostreptomyces psammosilenae TaxID=1892865 RepID=A0A852ZVJ8_9ACTN|nr:VTT domain-containing protein [Allostreptomyces psammosilenae]NYI05667.1 membrane protein DedA with SNARE-associated domain [Allostreptomyces psammosilenae]